MHSAQLILALGIALFSSTAGDGGGSVVQEAITADEQTLRSARIDSDGPSLLAFFRKLSLADAEQEQLESTIRQLGSGNFKTRTSSTRTLIAAGPPALPFLRRATRSTDLEIVHRAKNCIEEIEHQPIAGAAVPAAAAHLLAVRNPTGGVEALLNYLPYTEDEWVVEEVLAALRSLVASMGKIDPAMLPALTSPLAPRRAGAAYVIGRSHDPSQRLLVQRLLNDPDANVRLRAAQGLIAGQDQSGVPALIVLLGDAPQSLTWKAEELLFRIAGEQAPGVSMGDGSVLARQTYRDAWAAWWCAHALQVDLSHIEDGHRYLGLTLLAEMDSNKVWEFGPDGKARWKVDHLQGPMDAQMLPNGRVLIAEYQGGRVTERDLQGKVHWSRRVNGSPIACQRLTNGNTFIATHNNLLEVTPDGKEIPLRTPGQGLFIFGAQKLANGQVACIANPGILQVFDGDGKQLKTLRLGNNFGGWCGVEALPGGRFLVALLNNGKVIEIDSAGKTLWQCNVPGASHATRLPNGHTLVTSMMNRKVLEVDREGKTVKEIVTDGRPWRVHRR